MGSTSKGSDSAYFTLCVRTATGYRSRIVHSDTIAGNTTASDQYVKTEDASMRFIFFLIVLSSTALAGPAALRQSGFEPNAKGEPIRWTTWAARPEIAPRTFVAHEASRNRGDNTSPNCPGNTAPAFSLTDKVSCYSSVFRKRSLAPFPVTRIVT